MYRKIIFFLVFILAGRKISADSEAEQAEKELEKVTDEEIEEFNKKIKIMMKMGIYAKRRCTNLIFEATDEEPKNFEKINYFRFISITYLYSEVPRKARIVPVLECVTKDNNYKFTVGPNNSTLIVDASYLFDDRLYVVSKHLTGDYIKWEFVSSKNISEARKLYICNKIVSITKGSQYIIQFTKRSIRKMFITWVDDTSTDWHRYETLRCYYTDTDYFEFMEGNDTMSVYEVVERGNQHTPQQQFQVDYQGF